ncbi:MAG: hypothetical protein IJV39_05535 [Ruminococcus sp.]|nr:hypothetical protein [Ruminococcus sp.]
MKTFSNQASLSYNDNVINSNIVTGEIVEVLSVTKTAVDSTYNIGDIVTYVINIINSGKRPIKRLTLTDNLGACGSGKKKTVPLTYVDGTVTYFIEGVLQPDPTITDKKPLVITGITVPANGNTTIVYSVKVNEFADPSTDGEITNKVTVSGCSVSGPVVASETITTADEAQLAIVKSLCPDTITEHCKLNYTFTITNTGNTEASGDVIVTDTFDPALKDINVTYNGKEWREGVNYTYDETTGVFETLPNQITVPAATFKQKPTGVWKVKPGTVVLEVTGRI